MRRTTLALLGLLVAAGCAGRSGVLRDHASAVEAQRLGRLDEAREIYRKILLRDPTFEGAWNNLAALEWEQAHTSEALAAIGEELRAHPGLLSARTNEVILLYRTAGAAAARPKAEALVALGDPTGTAFLLLGLSHRGPGGDSKRALQAFEEAIILGPERLRSEALFARALALAAEGGASI